MVREEVMKCMSFCISIMWDWYRPQGCGDLSSPGAPADQGGDVGAGSAPFGHGWVPVSSAGCRTSCPPLHAKGRFPGLELTWDISPDAARLLSSAKTQMAAGTCNRNTQPCCQNSKTPSPRQAPASLAFSSPLNLLTDTHRCLYHISWHTYRSWRCSDCCCDLWLEQHGMLEH